MKITAKTTKEQLIKLIGANVKAVKEKDKDLFERIAYTDKMMKKDDSKVTRKDLVDLSKEVITLLGDALKEPLTAPVATPVAENATKKLTKGKAKKADSEVGESEETAEEPQETPKADEKKSSKKSSLGKKKETPNKKDGATDSSKKKTVQTKALVLAEVFPDTIEVDGQKYEIARDIANMGQLHDALTEKGDDIVFAMYWTPKHIRQFGYGVNPLNAPADGFPSDLDIAQCIHMTDDMIVTYAVSVYTEVCYMYTPEDIEEVDGIRYAGGVEYQIYRAV